MVSHKYCYAYVMEVSPNRWEASPESCDTEATHRLRQAIFLQGRVPVGRVKILRVEGYTAPASGIEDISPGVCWVPTEYEMRGMEWRDEQFCDPDRTTRYRISYVMDALDSAVGVTRIDQNHSIDRTPK